MNVLIYSVPLALAASIIAPAAAQPAQSSVQDPPIIVVGKLHPSPDVIVRTVSIGDLDLNSEAGHAEMEKRVGLAIDSMCAIPSPLPLYGRVMEQPCRDEAWASARPQMISAVRKAKGEP